jgi:hypothetical protein
MESTWKQLALGSHALSVNFVIDGVVQNAEPARNSGVKCEAGKTARVWLQGKGGGLTPGQALVLLPPKANEDQHSPAAYLSPLRTALIDCNDGHVNIVVCESDCLALKRGIENLPPGMQ